MQNYITTASIVTTAQMLYNSSNILSIFVEGEKDTCFYKCVFSEYMFRYKSLNKWNLVVELVKTANERGNNFLVGVIDSDFHSLTNNTGHNYNSTNNLLYTDDHDIETMLFMSDSLEKFMTVYGVSDKYLTIVNVRQKVISAIYSLSCLKLLNIEKGYNLYFDGIDYSKFIDKDTLDCNDFKMISLVLNRTASKRTPAACNEAEIRQAISEISSRDLPNRILCNGHDMLGVLSFGMQKLFASFNARDFSEDTIFYDLILAYDVKDFQSTQLYSSLTSNPNAIKA